MLKKTKTLVYFLVLLCSSLHATTCKQYIRRSSPPQWMLDQLAEDFAPFTPGTLSRATIDHVMADPAVVKSCQLVRCKIQDRRVSFKTHPSLENHGSLLSLSKSLRRLARYTKLPNLDFIVSLHDVISNPDRLPVPILTFCKDLRNDKHAILIPDAEVLKGYHGIMSDVRLAYKTNPWHTKRPKAIWRGATTGGSFTMENYRTFPRTQAIEVSLQYPELVDARFTALVQGAQNLKTELKPYMGNTLNMLGQLNYKYQLLIDGNSCAFSRAYWQLFSNSVILKRTSPFTQWYYKALQPYVHYIPIAYDLSDLPEKIEWAKAHDATCHGISIQATELAEESLDTEIVYYYLYLVLMKYATLQNF